MGGSITNPNLRKIIQPNYKGLGWINNPPAKKVNYSTKNHASLKRDTAKSDPHVQRIPSFHFQL